MTRLTFLKDGPIIVQAGNITLTMDGQEHAPVDKVALCRCGKSETKPFCDGGHTLGEEGLPEASLTAISFPVG